MGLGWRHGLGWRDLRVDGHLIHTLAELTPVLILFTDATRINLKLLRRKHDLPVRLLLIGMPLTIVFGTVIAAPTLEPGGDSFVVDDLPGVGVSNASSNRLGLPVMEVQEGEQGASARR